MSDIREISILKIRLGIAEREFKRIIDAAPTIDLRMIAYDALSAMRAVNFVSKPAIENETDELLKALKDLTERLSFDDRKKYIDLIDRIESRR